jgi:hypothetical protein
MSVQHIYEPTVRREAFLRSRGALRDTGRRPPTSASRDLLWSLAFYSLIVTVLLALS